MPAPGQRLVRMMACFVLAGLTLMCSAGTGIFSSAQAQGRMRCAPDFGSLVSAQGVVEIRDRNQRSWQAASVGEEICPGDTIRVGEYGRAGLILFGIGEIIRLDQNTALRLPDDPGPTTPVGQTSQPPGSVLELISGIVQFFSNQPKNLDIRAPFLNAGVEGTEFLMRATPDETFLVVLQGRVRATNPLGQITLTDNQAVQAGPGTPPVLQILVSPRDAVRWAVFYPPVQLAVADPGATQERRELPGGPSVGEEETPALREALSLQRRGRLADAIVRLDGISDARALTYRAGLMLSVGRRDEARRDIERVLAIDPRNAEAFALSATIAVADNNPELALQQASQAVDLNPS